MTVRTAATSLILGAVGAAVFTAGAAMLSQPRALAFWGVFLAVVGTIYIGSALTDGRRRPIIIETAVGLAFVGVALAGLWDAPGWLVGGWGMHALWDLAHHWGPMEDGCAHLSVETYPLLCLSFDLVVAGGGIALRFL